MLAQHVAQRQVAPGRAAAAKEKAIGEFVLAARACGKDPAAVEIRSFDPSGLDRKARKAFPLRLAHFLTDITRVRRELAWEPAYDLEATLADSYRRDYALRAASTPDFSADAALLAG